MASVAILAIVATAIPWRSARGVGECIRYLPDNCNWIARLDMRALLDSEMVQNIRQEFPDVEKGVRSDINVFNLTPEDISHVVIGGSDLDHPLVIVGAQRAISADEIMPKKGAWNISTQKVGEHTVYHGNLFSWYLPNDHTVVFSDSEVLQRVLMRNGDARLTESLQRIIGHVDLAAPIAAAVGVKGMTLPPGSLPVPNGIIEQLGNVEGVVMQLDLSGKLRWSGKLICDDAAAAENLKKAIDSAGKAIRKTRGAPSIVNTVINAAIVSQKGATLIADVHSDLISQAVGRMQGAQASRTRAVVIGQMRRIGLAMSDFYHATGKLPDQAIVNSNGTPILSWRVAILPYLGESSLHEEFRLNEPWDSPHNFDLVMRMPSVYRSIFEFRDTEWKTQFLLPVGPGTAYSSAKGIGLRDFADGTSWTILMVQADATSSVIWTKPDDLLYSPAKPLNNLGHALTDGFLVLMADGTCRLLNSSIDLETLRGLFSKAGHEVLEPIEN